MMRWCVFAVLAVALSCQLSSQADRYVVIIAWDGGKPSVIHQLIQQDKLPTLKKLIAQGSYTFKAKTIVPSSTLPSFASMLTGLSFQRHKVWWNSYRPELGTITAPTVFELAKNGKKRTAMVFSKEKLKHLSKPNTVDVVEYIRDNALKVSEVAARILQKAKPHLLFVHFSDPDSAGHGYGWGSETKGESPSPEFLSALIRCDEATGKLVDILKRNGQWEQTLLIISADHGGHGKTHGSADLEDVLIPWIASGGLASDKGEISQQDVQTMDTTATALSALGLFVPSDLDGKVVIFALRGRGESLMAEGKTLPFVNEWQGLYCGIDHPLRKVVTIVKDWEQLWREVHRKRVPMPAVPKIDFEKNMVLAVFMGEKRTGGYTIKITKAIAQKDKIIIYVQETSPPPDGFVTLALSQPYHIVVVPKVNLPVQFVTE